MKCTHPLNAGFDFEGNVTFNRKKADPSRVGVTFPCGRCIACRLRKAREKAIRCWHESTCHEKNIFLTLTYDDANVGDGRLRYRDWQLFMKSLREKVTRDVTDPELKEKMAISFMVTGEYGDKKKRPHWHAILFNYAPGDARHEKDNDRGEPLYTSKEIDDLWKKGRADFGAVTLESAAYVARYTIKKLEHGEEADRLYKPIHRTSCKHAIGKRWIEKYWRSTFDRGYIILQDGSPAPIPRYYVDWLKDHHPDDWAKYQMTVKHEQSLAARAQAEKEFEEYLKNWREMKGHQRLMPLTRAQRQAEIFRLNKKRREDDADRE